MRESSATKILALLYKLKKHQHTQTSNKDAWLLDHVEGVLVDVLKNERVNLNEDNQ